MSDLIKTNKNGVVKWERKGATEMVFPRSSGSSLSLYDLVFYQGSNINYAAEVGDLTKSSLVMAAINFLAQCAVEPRISVVKVDKDGKEIDRYFNHPLCEVWNMPNPYYAKGTMLKSLLINYYIKGNSYLFKVRNQLNAVKELWVIPAFMMRPFWQPNSTNFIDSYEYTVEGRRYYYPTTEIIHNRNGLNQNNMREGVSQFESVLREIYGDQASSHFMAMLMKNFGVVPFMITPKSGDGWEVSDAKAAKEKFIEDSTGDNRFKPIFQTIPLDVTKLSYNMKEMDITAMRETPESRVAAIMGLPAAVLQYLVGLKNGTSYASVKEARAQAFHQVLRPMMVDIAQELTTQFLPDFVKMSENGNGQLKVEFDFTHIAEVQEDVNELHVRVREDFKAGIIDLNTASVKSGYGEVDNGVGGLRYFDLANPQNQQAAMSDTSNGMGGNDPDVNFLKAMIPHHEDAIRMSEAIKESGKRKEVLTLAENIIETQTSEIEQMQEWLEEWRDEMPKGLLRHKRLIKQLKGVSLSIKALPSKSYDFDGITLNREPNELEKIAVKSVNDTQEKGKATLTKAFIKARESLIDEALKTMPEMSNEDYNTLSFSLSKDEAKKIKSIIGGTYAEGRTQIRKEIASQKKDVTTYGIYLRKADDEFDDLDELTTNTATRFLNDFKSKAVEIILRLKALRIVGKELIDRFKGELEKLSDKPLELMAGASVNSALGLGRSDELQANEDDIDYYLHSEILDKNTCLPCSEIDGITSKNLDDLPTAPFELCEGLDLCRGFNIAVVK